MTNDGQGMKNSTMARRGLKGAIGTIAAAALLLVGCAGSPPPQLLHLPSAAPVQAGLAPATVDHSVVIQLMLPVRLPDYLDHDALLVQQGPSGLARVPGWRWAEPLAQAVPRVLRSDLAALLGEGRVWTQPLPPGLKPTQQWRLEVSAFDTDEARRIVRLQARWTLAVADGSSAPRAFSSTIEAVVTQPEPAAIAAAHRMALAMLAASLVERLR